MFEQFIALMSGSRYFKMRVFSTILTVCFCFEFSAQITMDTSNLSSNASNGQHAVNQTESTPNYSFDQQVGGFNSTELTSGPIVIADKRTLFIPDLQYRNIGNEIEFWAGIGSPYGFRKQLVLKETLANSVNLYVILPENLSVDTIDFLQAMSKNQSLDYVIFEKVDRRSVRKYDHRNMEDTIFRIPKCCRSNEYLNDTLKDCAEALRQVNLDVNIFESNETGLDPDVRLKFSEYRLIPYYRDLQCEENGLKVMVEGLHGLIYNSSLIIQGTGILSHREYCVDVFAMENGTSDTAALYCYYQTVGSSDPDFYLPVLIISAICFALSAAAYGIVLRTKNIHKICFVVYSSTMCLAFVSLILMQVQSNITACNLFGFVFLFTTVLSYFWLLILCMELLYLVVCPIEKDRYKKRWHWYGGVSLGLTTLIFFVSLFSGQLWTPDVPNSFVMNYRINRCEFQTTFGRTFIIFAPMAVSLVGSIASLVAITTYINKNEANKDIKNHVDWVWHRNSYKFLSRTYFIIIIVALFWLSNAFFYAHQWGNGKTQLAFDVIKASLGVVTFIGLVGNKYTIAEIKEKWCKKKETINEEGLGLNGIPTPETPVEVDPLLTRHSTNLNSNQNNRVINAG